MNAGSAPPAARASLRDGAWGGISFLNAIPQGIGCAAAISLPVLVDLEHEPLTPPGPSTLEVAHGDPGPLLKWTLEKTLESRPGSPPARYLATIQSLVPIGKGLKSSSALSVAVARALRRALGAPPSPADVAAISARAALAAGVSLTGAFDDALASALGGVVVADVRAHWQMLSTEVPAGLQALVWVPETERPDLTVKASELRAPDMNGKEAVRLALRGDFLRAMKYNSLNVERALGYDYARLREAGLAKGAVAAGVTGNGPAVAFVVPRELTPQVAAALPWQGAKVLTAEFVRPGVVPG